MTRRCFILLLSVCLTAGIARANPGDDNYVRMARLSYIVGYVSFQHASDVDWSAASINMPLEPADRIYTGSDGRAEIEFDDGSIYRLAENTDIEVLSLREELIQLRILAGLSTLTVSSGLDFEINTPAAAFNARRKGVYRFNVDESGDTEAIVRKGELEAASNEFSRHIESGEVLRVRPGESSIPEVARYDSRDDWDEWNDRRDADKNAYASRRYLPESVYIGASDLDRYGRWVDVDSYGMAWVPFTVDVYWSPYSLGRWCYRPFFGWTWISYEPWGWLPYHYGRWHRSASFGWCWLPGPGFAFNFWSPALVTFYNGPGWISWCPLGPGDYYNIDHYYYNRRIYGYQLSLLRGLHTRAPGDPFNRHARGAFQTAGIDHFRNEGFRDGNRNPRVGNIDQPWRQGTFVRERLDIQPTKASFSGAPDRPVIRPRTTSTLPAVVRTSPEINSGDRERFAKITNPQISSLPSRTWQNRNDRGDADAASGPKANNRVTPAPRIDRTDQNSGGGSANAPASRGTRITTTPRASGNREDSGESTRNSWRSSPTTRPENEAPSVRQNSTRWRYEGTTPEQNQTIRPSVTVTPPAENRQQNNYGVPRSNGGGSWGDLGGGVARAPEARGSTTYSAPRQSAPSYSGGRNSGGGSSAAPSFGRSGGSPAPSSSGRSGGGISSGRSIGQRSAPQGGRRDR